MKHLFWRLSSSLTILSSSRFFYPVLTVLWFWRLYVILTRESSLASHQTASAKLRQLRRHSTSLLHLKLYTCQKRLLKRCPFLDAIETNTNLVSGLDIFIHSHHNLETVRSYTAPSFCAYIEMSLLWFWRSICHWVIQQRSTVTSTPTRKSQKRNGQKMKSRSTLQLTID